MSLNAEATMILFCVCIRSFQDHLVNVLDQLASFGHRNPAVLFPSHTASSVMDQSYLLLVCLSAPWFISLQGLSPGSHNYLEKALSNTQNFL